MITNDDQFVQRIYNRLSNKSITIQGNISSFITGIIAELINKSMIDLPKIGNDSFSCWMNHEGSIGWDRLVAYVKASGCVNKILYSRVLILDIIGRAIENCRTKSVSTVMSGLEPITLGPYIIVGSGLMFSAEGYEVIVDSKFSYNSPTTIIMYVGGYNVTTSTAMASVLLNKTVLYKTESDNIWHYVAQIENFIPQGEIKKVSGILNGAPITYGDYHNIPEK